MAVKLLPPSASATPPSSRSASNDRAVAERGHDRDELGVHGRAVQALVVVLDQDLPVGLDLGHRDVADAELAEVEAGERRAATSRWSASALLEGHRVGVEVHEHEALPDGDGDRPQAERVAVDLVLGDVRRADQAAVEGVRPGVVGALDGALHASRGLVAEPRAAVPADVVEAAQLAVLACAARSRSRRRRPPSRSRRPASRPFAGRRRTSCGRRSARARRRTPRRRGSRGPGRVFIWRGGISRRYMRIGIFRQSRLRCRT